MRNDIPVGVILSSILVAEHLRSTCYRSPLHQEGLLGEETCPTSRTSRCQAYRHRKVDQFPKEIQLPMIILVEETIVDDEEVWMLA